MNINDAIDNISRLLISDDLSDRISRLTYDLTYLKKYLKYPFKDDLINKVVSYAMYKTSKGFYLEPFATKIEKECNQIKDVSTLRDDIKSWFKPGNEPFPGNETNNNGLRTKLNKILDIIGNLQC